MLVPGKRYLFFSWSGELVENREKMDEGRLLECGSSCVSTGYVPSTYKADFVSPFCSFLSLSCFIVLLFRLLNERVVYVLYGTESWNFAQLIARTESARPILNAGRLSFWYHDQGR